MGEGEAGGGRAGAPVGAWREHCGGGDVGVARRDGDDATAAAGAAHGVARQLDSRATVRAARGNLLEEEASRASLGDLLNAGIGEAATGPHREAARTPAVLAACSRVDCWHRADSWGKIRSSQTIDWPSTM